MKTFNTLFNQKPYAHLLYDSQNFQIIDQSLVLESDIKINLPKQLIGKQIKQVELIPKLKHFEVIFTYKSENNIFNKIPVNDRRITIYLGVNQFVNNANNSIIMWHLLMKKSSANNLFLITIINLISKKLWEQILSPWLKSLRHLLELLITKPKYP